MPCNLKVVNVLAQQRIVTTRNRKTSVLIRLKHCGPVFFKLAFVSRLKTTSVKPHKNGRGSVHSHSRPEVKHVSLVLCVVDDVTLWFGTKGKR
jgi:hypothetical protein